MSEWITQLGVGGIIAILIIRMVLDFLTKKKNGNPGHNEELIRIMQQILDKQDRMLSMVDKIYEKILQR